MTLALGRLQFSIRWKSPTTDTYFAHPTTTPDPLERWYEEDRRLSEADIERSRWIVRMPLHSGRPF